MDDLISRQEAIDFISKASVWVIYTQGDSQKDEAEFVESIIKQTKEAIQSMLREDLPSAQPEIITCAQCVYYQQDHHYCEFLDAEFSLNDYCSQAERREG